MAINNIKNALAAMEPQARQVAMKGFVHLINSGFFAAQNQILKDQLVGVAIMEANGSTDDGLRIRTFIGANELMVFAEQVESLVEDIDSQA